MSIFGSFSNILSSIGNAIGSATASIGSAFSNGAGQSTPNQQPVLPPTAQSGAVVPTYPNGNSGYVGPYAPSYYNPPVPQTSDMFVTSGQPLPGATTQQQNQFAASGAAGSYQTGYTAPTPKTNSGNAIAEYDTSGKITGYRYTQGETLGSGTQSQTFGGQTGNIGGGASLLPSSLSGSSSSAGTSGLGVLYGTNQPVTMPYVQFAGSPDIFDAKTGARITPEQATQAGIFGPNGTLNNVQQINTPRPGVTTADQFSSFNNTNLSPAEAAIVNKDLGLNIDSSMLSNVENGNVETQLNDLRTKILNLIQVGATSEQQLIDNINAQDKVLADTKAQLRDLDLFTTQEIKKISDDPDFSKQMQDRRKFWLTQSTQSPTWLARLTLSNEIQGATDERQSLLDTFKLTKDLNDSNLQNYKMALDMLKPDSIAYKSDAQGNMHATYYDPISNKIQDTIVATGFPKDQVWSAPDTIKANGNVYSVSRNQVTGETKQVLIGKDPDFVKLGSSSTVPVGGTVKDLQQANAIIGTLPAGQQTQAIATVSAIQNGNDILNIINGGSTDVSTGPFAGRAQTQLQKLGIASDEFTKLQSLMTTYSANYIKGISGVAVSEQEYNRLAAALPTVKDTLAVAINKINTVNSVMNNTFQAQTGRTYQPTSTAETKTITVNGQTGTYTKGTDGQWHLN